MSGGIRLDRKKVPQQLAYAQDQMRFHAHHPAAGRNRSGRAGEETARDSFVPQGQVRQLRFGQGLWMHTRSVSGIKVLTAGAWGTFNGAKPHTGGLLLRAAVNYAVDLSTCGRAHFASRMPTGAHDLNLLRHPFAMGATVF